MITLLNLYYQCHAVKHYSYQLIMPRKFLEMLTFYYADNDNKDTHKTGEICLTNVYEIISIKCPHFLYLYQATQPLNGRA